MTASRLRSQKRLQAVDGHPHGGKAVLIFGDDIALKVAVMQIQRHVFQLISRGGKLLDGVFKKVHVVRLLMDLCAGGTQIPVDLQIADVGQAAVGIGGFWIRAGKIKIDATNRAGADILLQ